MWDTYSGNTQRILEYLGVEAGKELRDPRTDENIDVDPTEQHTAIDWARIMWALRATPTRMEIYDILSGVRASWESPAETKDIATAEEDTSDNA